MMSTKTDKQLMLETLEKGERRFTGSRCKNCDGTNKTIKQASFGGYRYVCYDCKLKYDREYRLKSKRAKNLAMRKSPTPDNAVMLKGCAPHPCKLMAGFLRAKPLSSTGSAQSRP